MAAYSLQNLDVVGFTEVPVLAPAKPRVLSAIFRHRESGAILFPPYCLDQDDLLNPVEIAQAEFDDLAAAGQITSRAAEPAQKGWALWLDDEGVDHYQPLTQITRLLEQEIYEKHMKSGGKALQEKDYVKARSHALVAGASNPQPSASLILRAAAEYCMTLHPSKFPDAKIELYLTEELAATPGERAAFRQQYLKMAEKVIPREGGMVNAAQTKPGPPKFFCSHNIEPVYEYDNIEPDHEYA